MIKLIQGDCLEVMQEFEDNSIDSIVTDPPAGIGFMGKEWDKDKGGRDSWIAWMEEIARESLRVLKPGGHALVWSLPRTSHWTATAWENAGYEVRDRVSHIFGSGFPKSLDVSKAIDREAGKEREVIGKKYQIDGRCRTDEPSQGKSEKNLHGGGINEHNEMLTMPATVEAQEWDGWGTALKPAIEDWWLFRKPLSESTVAKNVLRWGTGAINIDGCRIETNDKLQTLINNTKEKDLMGAMKGKNISGRVIQRRDALKGRWPAHIVHDGSDEVLEMFPETKSNSKPGMIRNVSSPFLSHARGVEVDAAYGDSGSASRFFYCAKPSRSERNDGLQPSQNHHPTVKPLALMRYLITLITPPNGKVLDLFAGSGTTGKAAAELGFDFVGIEKEADYFIIAEKRIAQVTP